ncbi:MAG: CcmD family protein [Bacteroidota bacterium]
MKMLRVCVKSLGLIFLLLTAQNGWARDAEGATYDVQILDSGQVVIGKEVNLRVALLSQTADGAVMYAETHRVTTNDGGVARMVIGSGKSLEGDFDQLDLATGVYFVRVEADPRGGENYQLVSVARLLSVSRIQQWLFANEKLNTVIVIIAVIWVGIIVYLLLTGKRVSKLESELRATQPEAGDSRLKK